MLIIIGSLPSTIMIGFGTQSELRVGLVLAVAVLVFWAVVVVVVLELVVVEVVEVLFPEVTRGPTRQAFIIFSTLTHLCTCRYGKCYLMIYYSASHYKLIRIMRKYSTSHHKIITIMQYHLAIDCMTIKFSWWQQTCSSFKFSPHWREWCSPFQLLAWAHRHRQGGTSCTGSYCTPFLQGWTMNTH